MMVGKGVQRHYQHAAAPQGHRISVTARTLINPETVIPPDQRAALQTFEELYQAPTENVFNGVLILDGTSQDGRSDSKAPAMDDEVAKDLARQRAGWIPPKREKGFDYPKLPRNHVLRKLEKKARLAYNFG
ncbi:hypothetical protein HKX48_009289 [Thoreauomyces humboldtii]|nr:hypothetical protein HKX48_009289 [Thoreauomyces humboldtii]